MCMVISYSMVCSVVMIVFYFFKQKTAYEVRISDWSSDVCSSDLPERIDLSSPEDVLIEVIADESPYERWDWKGFKIDSCTVIGGKDGVTGAASYEQSYGGFLDYVLEDIIDCPKREGWFVVEEIGRAHV